MVRCLASSTASQGSCDRPALSMPILPTNDHLFRSIFILPTKRCGDLAIQTSALSDFSADWPRYACRARSAASLPPPDDMKGRKQIVTHYVSGITRVFSPTGSRDIFCTSRVKLGRGVVSRQASPHSLLRQIRVCARSSAMLISTTSLTFARYRKPPYKTLEQE